MSHSVIIIDSKIACLQGVNITGGGALEELKTEVHRLDGWLNSVVAQDEETAEQIGTVHEHLESVQATLTQMCSEITNTRDELRELP